MKIILDTNIIRQDFLLNSRKSEMFLDYLGKTEDIIVIPQIIYQEISALYKTEALKYINEIRKSRQKLNNILIDEGISDITLDANHVTAIYREYLLNKLGVRERDIVPYKNEYLPKIVNRSIDKLYPFSETRQEFRDYIIWLTNLDIASEDKNHSLIFISANTKDFADETKSSLHPSLEKEATGRDLVIHYYPSLDDFLKAKAIQIEFITNDWLLSSLDFKTMEKDLENDVGHYDQRELTNHLKWQDEEFYELLSAGIISLDLEQFYVYQMVDGSFRVEATFVSEFEIEYNAESQHEEEYLDYEFNFDHFKGDVDWHPVTKYHLVTNFDVRYLYTIIESQFHIIIKDENIEDAELIEWYIQ